ncbi:MAG: hypothetical protein BWX58_01765 [Deltaproteobacteria bacterium ADurb.Bin026]|nr:MAG: hypothetical protein BWX58_01765 [Deltaproteobacteria bacterium ADurb.Bin026]
MSFRGAQACPSEKGRRLEGWKVGGLATEVRGQRSEARGQKSEGWRVRRLATEDRRLNTTVIPAGF